jgi:hypothetical protein
MRCYPIQVFNLPIPEFVVYLRINFGFEQAKLPVQVGKKKINFLEAKVTDYRYGGRDYHSS